MTHIVIPDLASPVVAGSGEIVEIDISAYTGSDYISVALPDYPSTKITEAQSFIDFTSNPDGDFGVGPTDHIAFSSSSPALPGSDGNAEMRIPISLLTSIDKKSVTGFGSKSPRPPYAPSRRWRSGHAAQIGSMRPQT
jgi:hypothetical protein